jgi:hypothetical protein
MKSVLWKARSILGRVRTMIRSQRFGVSPTRIYDESFYDGAGCMEGLATAEAVTGAILELLGPESLFDVGCGRGAHLQTAAKRGVLAVGCEGSAIGVGLCPPEAIVFQHDLRVPLAMNRRFDVVMCIEVAEHIPARWSRTLIHTVGSLAETFVVFSSPPPGTVGDDHINCRSASFWDGLMEEERFRRDVSLTNALRTECRKIQAPEWIREHVTVYRRVDVI